jgi:hypothetical protein
MSIRIALLVLVSRALFAQVVEGTVTSVGDARPLAGVKVDLEQKDSSVRQTFTNTAGVFHFDAVADGDYILDLTMEDYRPAERRSAMRRFHVAAGSGPVRLDAKMVRLARVSGRVKGDGRGIAGAQVLLLVPGNFVGEIGTSGKDGEFEFHDIEPGTYILSARPGKTAPPPEERDGRKLGWVRTWYPDATDPAGAAKVVVSSGVDVPGQDIALRTAPARKVAGRVLSPAGEPMEGVTVTAMPPEEFQAKELEVETRTQKDGLFEFALPEGDWRLTANVKIDGVDWYAATVEAVADRDIERVELRFAPPFALDGKVVRAPGQAPAKRIAVMLAPKEGGSRVPFAGVEEDGSFRIESLAQGVYRFQPISPGAPYYLASVEMNGRDVTGQWVEIAPGTLPVTITYRADGGTVRGTVEDCDGATVVLAPRDAALQYAEFIRSARCGQDGRYEVTAVRPGDYYAWAFDRAPGMLELSSFAGVWTNEAARVTVRAGEASDVPLKVTERR